LSKLSIIFFSTLVVKQNEHNGLIKWEFQYTLFAFQDELVDRLLFIKDQIFLKQNKYNVEIAGTIIIVIMF
jgi:hypothetical protein